MKTTNKYKLCRHKDGSIWKAGHGIYGLCSAYNHATDPADYRSEHEHIRMNAYARAIKNRIKRNGFTLDMHYSESGSGCYWPQSV